MLKTRSAVINASAALVIVLLLIAGIYAGFKQSSPSRFSEAAASSSALADVPQRISVTGVSICLPPKNPGEPTTMECAYGLQADSGEVYALDLHVLETGNTFRTGQHLHLEGLHVPVEQLSSDSWRKYNIRGIIQVTMMKPE